MTKDSKTGIQNREGLGPALALHPLNKMMAFLIFCLQPLLCQARDNSLFSQAIEKALDKSYDEARICIAASAKSNPHIADFLLGWVDFEENNRTRMEVLEECVKRQLENLAQDQGLEPSDALFLEGLWHGLRALAKTRRQDMFTAYQSGRRAYECLRKALTLDPSKYDAYYGLGLYHKMKYELGGTLWFVPQSPKDGDIAKRYFRLAEEKGIFTRELALNMLIDLSF